MGLPNINVENYYLNQYRKQIKSLKKEVQKAASNNHKLRESIIDDIDDLENKIDTINKRIEDRGFPV